MTFTEPHVVVVNAVQQIVLALPVVKDMVGLHFLSPIVAVQLALVNKN